MLGSWLMVDRSRRRGLESARAIRTSLNVIGIGFCRVRVEKVFFRTWEEIWVCARGNCNASDAREATLFGTATRACGTTQRYDAGSPIHSRPQPHKSISVSVWFFPPGRECGCRRCKKTEES